MIWILDSKNDISPDFLLSSPTFTRSFSLFFLARKNAFVIKH